MLLPGNHTSSLRENPSSSIHDNLRDTQYNIFVQSRQIHLIRHGEVDNPDGILYGRLPGFQLSARGREMAELAAKHVLEEGRAVAALYASPLLRARQSAAPFERCYGLQIRNEPRIIEPTNVFEGKSKTGRASLLKHVKSWPALWNPLLPSWGEPYARIFRRVRAAMEEAWANAEAEGVKGDIVMLSHQAPIWNQHLSVAGKPFAHNPAKRRCDLSSITTFVKHGNKWVELGYASPAAHMIEDERDRGAV